MEWQPFNINETVRVKLTDAGAAELKRQHDDLRTKFPSIAEWHDRRDAEGWCTMQLWDVMKRLGFMFSLGALPREMPFSMEIGLPIPAPPAVAKE